MQFPEAVQTDEAVDRSGEFGELRFVDVSALRDPLVGHRIRYYRRTRKLSQLSLARAAGLTQTDISRLERTPGSARLEHFIKVCRVLRITIEVLLEQQPELLKLEELQHLRPRD